MIPDAPASAVTAPEQAARLLGIVDTIWRSVGRSQAGIPEFIAARQARERRLRDTLGDANHRAAHRKGLGTGVDDGIARALNLG